MIISREIQEFLEASDHYDGGLRFGNGHVFFDAKLKHIEAIYRHFTDTGNNLLTAYFEVVLLSWEKEDHEFMASYEETSELESYLSAIRGLQIFDFEFIGKCKAILKTYRKNYRDYNEWVNQKPRRDAQNFLSKVKVRSQVFELYGKACLSCGSEENISIDHVIPIHKGGPNEIDNLQPLCKSCNSRKSTDIIDYRNG